MFKKIKNAIMILSTMYAQGDNIYQNSGDTNSQIISF